MKEYEELKKKHKIKLMFNNKNILTTGGTGSFGSLFVENIKEVQSKRLIIYSWMN